MQHARTVSVRIMPLADDAGAPVSESWEPLSVVDFCVLGLVGTFQAFAVLVCVHLIWWRTWPPYVTKNVDLVAISTISGVLWMIAIALTKFVRREKGDILAACDFDVSQGCRHCVQLFFEAGLEGKHVSNKNNAHDEIVDGHLE